MLYDAVIAFFRPAAWWGRLETRGLECIPEHGPLLIVPNHDSQWDPILIAVAARPRRRLRFLAKASLWRIPGLGPLLYALGQIPIHHGAHDTKALDRAVKALAAGSAICIFPEGRLSWGEHVPARSGVGRLAQWCPGVQVVLCTVEESTVYARFPRRPRVRVSFFHPAAGDPRQEEDAPELAARLLAEVRDRVPPAPAGRRAQVGGPKRVRKRLATPRVSRS